VARGEPAPSRCALAPRGEAAARAHAAGRGGPDLPARTAARSSGRIAAM